MKPALRHWLEVRAASVAGGTVCSRGSSRPLALSLGPSWPRRAAEAAGSRGPAEPPAWCGGRQPRPPRSRAAVTPRGPRECALKLSCPRRPPLRSAGVWPA